MRGAERLAGAVQQDEDILPAEAANARRFASPARAAGELKSRHIPQEIGHCRRLDKFKLVPRDHSHLTGIIKDRQRIDVP